MYEFMIFSIGPVQSYISAARRTQDLWAGSRILSQIMISALQAAPLAALRYPLPDADGNWPESVPNRAVIVVEQGQGAAVAQAMETAAKNAWAELADNVQNSFNQIMPSSTTGDWQPIWERQVAHWLELYWIVRPLDENYGSSYRAAGRLLDARKLLRSFPPHAEEDIKSTLDPAYQALRGQTNAWSTKRFWDESRRRAGLGVVRRGERLSSIDVVKRLAQKAGQITQPGQRFPSTSSLASADFRLELMRQWPENPDDASAAEAARQAVRSAVTAFVAQLDALVDAFPNEQNRLRFAYDSHEPIPRLQMASAGNATLFGMCRYDGDYFYPEFYTESRLLEATGRNLNSALTSQESAAVNAARGALLDLYKACTTAGLDLPSAYYAVIAMDGDQMGSILSDPQMTADFHEQISLTLSTFSTTVVPALAGEAYPAALVYAGGDDVLVLAPVSVALPLAESLRLRFTEHLAPIIAPLGHSATMSAGIAIVHQQNPLQTAVLQAHRGEALAKDVYERQALVVNTVPRSGAERLTGSKWELVSSSGTQRIAETLAALQTFISSGQLSGKFAYELRDEAEALSALPDEGVTLEIGRLLKRHSADNAAQTAVLAIMPDLGALAAALGSDQTASGIEQLAEWAILTRFLALGGRKS